MQVRQDPMAANMGSDVDIYIYIYIYYYYFDNTYIMSIYT